MSLAQLIRGPNRLSLRLLLWTVLFSAAVALASTGWQLYRDYQVDVRDVRERLSESGRTRLSAIGHALWSLDRRLIESQLNDMLLVPNLEYARVDSRSRMTVERGERPPAEWAWKRRFPITHETGLGTVELGELVIVGDLRGPYQRLRESVPVILATEALDTFLVAIFVLVLIHWFITRHLVRMHHYVSHLRTDTDAEPLRLARLRPPSPGRADELDDLATAINRMRESLSHELAERTRAEEQAAHLAMYDPVTDLPNRRLLLDRLGQAIERNRREGGIGALLFLDLDRFKDVNDTHGHKTGDRLLVEAGRMIAECVRSEDTVARVGGDEFLVLLPNLAREVDSAAVYAERVGRHVVEALTGPIDVGGQTVQCGVSLGVALFPTGQEGPEEVLRAGDTAMYRAKYRGGNCVVLYREEMEQEILERLEVERDLQRAIDNGDLEVYYQPQVLADGQIVGLEALVRWWRGGAELVYPADFVEIAEQTGLIQSVGERVLDTVCRDIAQWSGAGVWPRDARVAVNISPAQLRDPRFADRVLGLLAAHGVDGAQLEFELTEGMVASAAAGPRGRLDRMRAAGIRIAVDDFGTGYSSLAYLKHLPIDRLKIDHTFVQGLPDDADDSAIIEAILAMAVHLELGVVAEGVETRAQLDFLHACGCRIFQGHYFLPAGDVETVARHLAGGYVEAAP